jgi:GGDEF domain-containing protein
MEKEINFCGSKSGRDLDKFKEVNDTYGHDAGDWVLGEVGKEIKQNTRRSDRAYRIGGDEFTVIWQMVDRSNFLAALINPRLPSLIRSGRLNPWFWYCLATDTTNLKKGI